MSFNTSSERHSLPNFHDRAPYLWDIINRNTEGFSHLAKIADNIGDLNANWHTNQNELLTLAYGLVHQDKERIRVTCDNKDTYFIETVSTTGVGGRAQFPFVSIIVKRNASDFLRNLPVDPEMTGIIRSLTETANHIVRIYRGKHDTAPGFYVITNKTYPSFLLNILTLIGHFIPEYRLPDAMLTALAAKQFDSFIGLLEPLAQDYVVNSHRKAMVNTVASFCRQLPDTTRQQIDSKIAEIQRQINGYESELSTKYRQLQQEQDVRFRIIALGEYKTQTEEFLPYILNKLQVTNAIWESNRLNLLIQGPLLYFDSKAVTDLIGSTRSNKLNQSPQRKWLFQNIFVDQKHLLHTYAVCRWDMASNEIGQGRFASFSDNGRGIRHPHLQSNLSCYGQYRAPINKLLQQRDLITALEQTIASTCSFNFFDGPALDCLCQDLFSDDANRKCIEIPETHEWYSVRDYLNSEHCNPTTEPVVLMPEEE